MVRLIPQLSQSYQPASTSSSLFSISQTDPLWFQRGYVILHIEVAHLGLATVYHIHDIIYRDGGLRYVGS
jgi:hypothetical protein